MFSFLLTVNRKLRTVHKLFTAIKKYVHDHAPILNHNSMRGRSVFCQIFGFIVCWFWGWIEQSDHSSIAAEVSELVESCTAQRKCIGTNSVSSPRPPRRSRPAAARTISIRSYRLAIGRHWLFAAHVSIPFPRVCIVADCSDWFSTTGPGPDPRVWASGLHSLSWSCRIPPMEQRRVSESRGAKRCANLANRLC